MQHGEFREHILKVRVETGGELASTLVVIAKTQHEPREQSLKATMKRCWDETSTQSFWRCRVSLKCSRAGPEANASKEGASCNTVLSDLFLNEWPFLFVFWQNTLSKCAKILFVLLITSLFSGRCSWVFSLSSWGSSLCWFHHDVPFYNKLCGDHPCELLCVSSFQSHRQCLPPVRLHHL